MFFLQTDNISLIATKFNITGYCHTGNSAGYYLGDTAQIFNSWPTFSGSYEGLSNLLQVFDCMAKDPKVGARGPNNIEKISLRVTAPVPSTLRTLIEATGSCADNPNTLGVDFDANAYFCINNMKDMMLMLEALCKTSEHSSHARRVPSASFRLFDLDHPIGIF